jgi:hypothetical protein
VSGDRSDKDTRLVRLTPALLVLRRQLTRSARHLTCSVSVELRSAPPTAVKRGDLKPVKTLRYAANLASFLTKLRRLSEADVLRVDHTPGASKSTERS